MSSYASQKGRAAPVAPAAIREKPLAELSEADKASIEANKDFVLEHMPDMLPFIRDLVATDQIDGWRNIKQTKLLDEAANE